MNNIIEMGRPYKMENWIVELKQVLDAEEITFLTDADLLFMVNQRLPKEHRIERKTFERWKGGKFHPNETIGEEFIECVHIALIKEKQALGRRLLIEPAGSWQKIAFILERKFSEWNLKHISENINRSEQQTVINITAGNAEQKALIDNIINAEFELIKPIELKQKNVEQNNDTDYELDF